MAMRKFVVPVGTKCHVRRVGSADWRPFVTKRETGFDSHGIADNGGCWTFETGGWEMKVATCFVIGREPKTPKTCRSKGAFSTTRGKGASRRRNMRAAKRR
jgi:hypothetical protein